MTDGSRSLAAGTFDRARTASRPSGPRIGLYVVTDDVDTHYARARAAGAEIPLELADQPWGHRMYGAIDPEGHEWGFATSLRSAATT